MRMPSFSRALTTVVGVPVLTAALALTSVPVGHGASAAASATVEQAPVAGTAGDPYREPFRFLSAPDLFNADIGDVSRSPYYREGAPNSWTPTGPRRRAPSSASSRTSRPTPTWSPATW